MTEPRSKPVHAAAGVGLGRYLAQTLRLMVGVPDYDTYVQHMQACHPGKPAMSYEAFFLERQKARYAGAGRGRCC